MKTMLKKRIFPALLLVCLLLAVSCACAMGEECQHRNYDWTTYEFSETEHWLVCKDCGAAIYRQPHYVSCKTGICVECDQKGTGEIVHQSSGVMEATETEHWYTCVNCGEEYDRGSHSISCKTGLCVWCDRPGTGYMSHNYGWGEWQHNGVQHWRVCKDCGEEIDREEHRISCATGKCVDCDQEGFGRTVHDCDWGDWNYTDTEHWYVCKDCGKDIYRDNHRISCKTGLCVECEQKGTGEVEHDFDWQNYMHSETEHWAICKNCGEKSIPSAHSLSCKTGLCTECGQKGKGYIDHNLDYDHYEHSETEHWRVCKDCGKELYRETHQISCKWGLCVVCGYKGTGEIAHNYDDDDYQYNETDHWQICKDCGNVTEPQHHVKLCTSEVCLYCGLKTKNAAISHRGRTEHTDTEHWFLCGQCHEKLDLKPHEFENGVCAVCGCPAPERVPGDANSDGKVTTADVLQLLKYVSGWGVEVNAANSDVTGDGKITTADVLLLLKYVSGWGVILK